MLENLTNRIARLVLGVGNKLTASFGKTTHVQRTIRVERPPREVYAFWRNFELLGRAAHGVVKVEIKDDKRSRWTVAGPLGLKLIWSAELKADEPNRRLAWQTISPTDVPHTGQVHFRSIDGGRVTEIAIEVDYHMPLGRVGDAIAWLLRSDGPAGFVTSTIAEVKGAIERTPIRAEAGRQRVRVSPIALHQVDDTAIGSVANQPITLTPDDHKSRAAKVAESKHLLDLSKGPPAAPTATAPRKTRRVGESGELLFDRRARQRTQH